MIQKVEKVAGNEDFMKLVAAVNELIEAENNRYTRASKMRAGREKKSQA